MNFIREQLGFLVSITGWLLVRFGFAIFPLDARRHYAKMYKEEISEIMK